jgi:hypothetical protein
LIDPFTAISLATTAFNGIKSAINTGKDIQSMGAQLGQWGKAISDLDFAHQKAQKPPWYKAMGGGVEAKVMEIWTHKQKAKEMREELRSYISALYGPSAWDEIVHMEVQMRKEQREAVYAAQEKKEAIVNAILVTIAVVAVAGALALIIYFIGAGQGKW